MYIRKISMMMFIIEDKLNNNCERNIWRFPIYDGSSYSMRIDVRKGYDGSIIFDNVNGTDTMHIRFIGVRESNVLIEDVITGRKYSVDPWCFISKFIEHLKRGSKNYKAPLYTTPGIEYYKKRFNANINVVKGVNMLFDINQNIIYKDIEHNGFHIYDIDNDGAIVENRSFNYYLIDYDDLLDSKCPSVEIWFQKRDKETNDPLDDFYIPIYMEQINSDIWIPSDKNDTIISSSRYIESMDNYRKILKSICNKFITTK